MDKSIDSLSKATILLNRNGSSCYSHDETDKAGSNETAITLYHGLYFLFAYPLNALGILEHKGRFIVSTVRRQRVVVYFDYIVIFSCSLLEHNSHVRKSCDVSPERSLSSEAQETSTPRLNYWLLGTLSST